MKLGLHLLELTKRVANLTRQGKFYGGVLSLKKGEVCEVGRSLEVVDTSCEPSHRDATWDRTGRARDTKITSCVADWRYL